MTATSKIDQEVFRREYSCRLCANYRVATGEKPLSAPRGICKLNDNWPLNIVEPSDYCSDFDRRVPENHK